MSGCSALHLGSGNGKVDARSAFEALRSVEGDWTGEVVEGTGAGFHPVDGRYHATAGGSVVEATMFRGLPRETVMMIHFDGDKLMLTQYGEVGNSGTLVGDLFVPMFSDTATSPKTEPEGVGVRFFLAGEAKPNPADDVYLHDVAVLIGKDGTKTIWNFYKDGAPAKDVYVELTQKSSPPAAAAATAAPRITP
jgi:hypothetical protein